MALEAYTHTRIHSRSESDFKKPGAHGRRVPDLNISYCCLPVVLMLIVVCVNVYLLFCSEAKIESSKIIAC